MQLRLSSRNERAAVYSVFLPRLIPLLTPPAFPREFHSVNKRKEAKERRELSRRPLERIPGPVSGSALSCSPGAGPACPRHPGTSLSGQESGPACGSGLGTAPVQSNSCDILEGGNIFWLPMARAEAWAQPSSPRPSQECKYFSL